jgi:3-oxoacyl-[acyl-carrier-protein] synthase-3
LNPEPSNPKLWSDNDEKNSHSRNRAFPPTAASIPIALDEALEMGVIGDGSTVLFLGLGAGLTWGAVISKLVS